MNRQELFQRLMESDSDLAKLAAQRMSRLEMILCEIGYHSLKTKAPHGEEYAGVVSLVMNEEFRLDDQGMLDFSRELH